MRYVATVTMEGGGVEMVTLARKTPAAARKLLAEVYPDTTVVLYEWPRNLTSSTDVLGLFKVNE